MVPSSANIITAYGERLTCYGFSLGETVRLVKYEFIADYFGGLSLSPRRGDVDAIFMGSTRRRASTPWWAMIEDSTEEFLMVSSREGTFGLPSPRRRDTGASLSPIVTTSWLKDILDITVAQQAESSLQRLAKATVLSPWDISLNQLSHFTNSIFFRVNIYFSLIFFAKYFCDIYFEYTTPCAIMIYATPDALRGHAPQRLHTLLLGATVWSK
jgi:hypothetical protein